MPPKGPLGFPTHLGGLLFRGGEARAAWRHDDVSPVAVLETFLVYGLALMSHYGDWHSPLN